jgi:hypothetical protein
VGGSPGLEGPFTLLTLPAPIPDIGYTEGPAGTLYIEDKGVKASEFDDFGG